MKSIRSAAGVSTLAVGLACLLSGCGGSTNSNSNINFKAFDAIYNGGNAVVNASGAAPINLTVPDTTASPTYEGASAGTQTASFTLSLPSAFTSPTYPTSLNSGAFYTAALVGIAGVASTDARYPKLLLMGDDQTSPASNDSRIRVVQAAPDAGSVNVFINGVDVSYNTTYSVYTGYSELAAANATVSVVSTTGSTTLVPSTVFSTVAGHRYTLYVAEPTTSPATYAFQLQEDS